MHEPQDAKTTTGRAKILVFDDSETVLELTAMVLEEAGHQVVTLSSPALFPATLNREKPDLVLMDVEMPVVMGGSLVELARKNKLHRCPMVLYSDKANDVLAGLSQKCGADGYLRKTHDHASLLKAVADQLARWKRA